MRGPRLGPACLVAVLALSGCGAAAVEQPEASAPASASRSVRVPADGVLLRDFGYRFGPLDTFSLPRTSVVSTGVDQADNVTLVLSTPSASDLATYLRRALPAAGYTVTADDQATSTLTFTGQGWTGRFTGDSRTSAVLLRPA